MTSEESLSIARRHIRTCCEGGSAVIDYVRAADVMVQVAAEEIWGGSSEIYTGTVLRELVGYFKMVAG